jgi:hypothetical protein
MEGNMALLVEIRCVNKSDRTNPHEQINYVGGINADGTHWILSQDQAIKGIEEGKYSFYVDKAGKQVKVIIAVSSYGHKYLKTEADTTTSNNLLSLPECP